MSLSEISSCDHDSNINLNHSSAEPTKHTFCVHPVIDLFSSALRVLTGVPSEVKKPPGQEVKPPGSPVDFSSSAEEKSSRTWRTDNIHPYSAMQSEMLLFIE